MKANRPKRQAVERESQLTSDGYWLQVVHFHAATQSEKAILFVPPLIGGSYIFFGRQFRRLIEGGYRIVSYNYRGHRPSEGQFDLQTFFRDGVEVTQRLRERNPDTPIGAIGTCSGSMPIFRILEEDGGFFWKLAFVNAIHHIWQAATPAEAARMYYRAHGLRPPRSVGQAVNAVLAQVFPEVDQGPDHFGILPYSRVRTWRVARDYLTARQPRLRAVHAPALCCYADGDELLGLHDQASINDYRSSFSTQFDQLNFATFASDHFMNGVKDSVADRILTFFDLE